MSLDTRRWVTGPAALARAIGVGSTGKGLRVLALERVFFSGDRVGRRGAGMILSYACSIVATSHAGVSTPASARNTAVPSELP